MLNFTDTEPLLEHETGYMRPAQPDPLTTISCVNYIASLLMVSAKKMSMLPTY